MDPAFSTIKQAEVDKFVELLKQADKSRKQYTNASVTPLQEAKKDDPVSKLDAPLVGKEFHYLQLLVMHRWNHDVIKFLCGGEVTVDSNKG